MLKIYDLQSKVLLYNPFYWIWHLSFFFEDASWILMSSKNLDQSTCNCDHTFSLITHSSYSSIHFDLKSTKTNFFGDMNNWHCFTHIFTSVVQPEGAGLCVPKKNETVLLRTQNIMFKLMDLKIITILRSKFCLFKPMRSRFHSVAQF